MKLFADMHRNKDPIILNGNYTMKWNDYSKIDDTSTGCFKVLINKII